MDQICQKVLLVLTQLGIQTFTSSTLALSFLFTKMSIAIASYLKQTVRFEMSQNIFSSSEYEYCEAKSDKS